MSTWLKPDLLLLDEHTAALDPKSADQMIKLSDEAIKTEKLTVFMLIHSMQQAVNLGDRLITVHKGEIIHDIVGAQKSSLRVSDLLDRFNDVRRRDQLDETSANVLQKRYI